jgi:hypothetical protein
MKFWEAMRELEAGRKVRCEYWGTTNYIDRNNVCKWFETIPSAHHFFDEWEFYESAQELE